MQTTPTTAPAPAPAAPASALLVLEGLGLDYGAGPSAVTAVADVSLQLAAGERLAVVGPSGCGKSSLLRTIAGFHPPTRGRLTFDGRSHLRPGPDRAVVFQELDQLFPWLTVLGNVAQALRYQGVRKGDARRQATEQLTALGLGNALDRHPHELSGGMKQRVAIARALALQPRLLLMDEPFGSLDAITRARLQEEVRTLGERTGVAMFFVTHDIEEALTVGQRVLVLSRPPSSVRAVIDVPGDAEERHAVAGRLRGLLVADQEASETSGAAP